MRWAKPARALRRSDMDDEVDVAPVDAEIERRSGDHGPQAVRLHRLLHAPPLADVERAVMKRDRQRVLVHPPKLLEHHLRLAARVDEDQRRAMAADRVVDSPNGIAGGVAGPRHPLVGIENGDVGFRAAGDRDQVGAAARRVLGDQPAAQLVRFGDRGRKADGLQVRHETSQAGEAQRQKVASLRGHQ